MKLRTTALPSSDGFRANRQAHLEMLATVRAAVDHAAAGGGSDATPRHVSPGKMPP